MLLALFLLAETSVSPPVESAPPSATTSMVEVPPSPLNDPGNWITTDDYPATSLHTFEQGVAGFSLSVNSRGEVTNCKIVASSGSATLDQATCYLASQRARFRSALGSDGKPIDGTYRNRVRWVLPRLPGPKASTLVFSFVVDQQGIVSDCKVEQRAGAALDLPNMQPYECNEGSRLLPYRNDKGEAVAKRIRMRMEVEEIPVTN